MVNIKPILKYLLIIAIISILIYFIITQVGLRNIYSNLKQINPAYLILAFLSVNVYMFFWHLRGYYILCSIKKINFFSLIPIFLVGLFLNTITPGARAGGEPVKIHFLSKKFGISRTDAMAASMIGFIYNFFIFSALVLFSILFVVFYIDISIILKSFLLFVLAFIPLLLFFLFLSRNMIIKFFMKRIFPIIYPTFICKKIRERFETCLKFEEYLNQKREIFSRFILKSLKDKRRLFIGIIIAFLVHLFKFLAAYILFLSLGQNIEFIHVVIVVTLATLLGDLSLLPGGMGITEGLMIALYLGFSINPAIAIIVTFADRAMEYFYSLFLGGIAFIFLTLRRE